MLRGEADAITPLAEHRAMAALIPGAKLAIVPGAGHMTPIEKPEAVARALRDWLLAWPNVSSKRLSIPDGLPHATNRWLRRLSPWSRRVREPA
ncbi:alpha/beta fold hydrolase [Methylobacterium nigriterrae]|uniref:alpha/beta fold hydrolase n=1 Tax=Methylobacterium nigriterrae TaxID=3127512 RepID=UPI00301364C1